MPELSRQDSPLLQNPPPAPITDQATPPPAPIVFSRLTCASDQKFLALLDHEAGRAVIIEIHGKPGMSGHDRRALWQGFQARGVNMTQLGIAAKALEREGWNWREARISSAVLKAAQSLSPKVAH
ncbi:hypothetical protein HY630_01945 [Candidatus Uhrbacteria bacterium]|nr:hypothetical protein [Candidatus Uhrbacteria bacterium]